MVNPWQVDFIFSDKEERGKAKAMEKGQKVTIEGTVKKLEGAIRIKDCRFVGQAVPPLLTIWTPVPTQQLADRMM